MYLKDISNGDLKNKLTDFIADYKTATIASKIESTAETMWIIREHLLEEQTAQGRLALFDLSLQLELLITKQIGEFPETNLQDLIRKIGYLSTASAASGYTEIWEWKEIKMQFSDIKDSNLSIERLTDLTNI